MATALNDASGGTSQAAVGYFVDQKKGEVNELKQLLKNINVERDVKRKREIIKKVIAYMTLGIDVSRLFTDMIMAIETKDIVIKKMVYLYLCNYAHSEPEMAIMCINSLRRDCDNEDPLVRGSALRSLCSLRLESILEYVEQPLKKSLTDLSAYVRKTGVMGILKLNLLSPNLVESNGYLEQLYRMLQDTDSNVVTNVIFVINELCISTGGLEVRQSTVMALLNRIGEFSEWGLNSILDLVARYQPASEDEAFAIMNLLDPVLRTANSGSVLATFKCFMKMTAGMPDLQVQIYSRAKPPLLTLVTGAHAESQFTTLKHLELILHQPAAKGIFDDEYRQFFVRYNEPPHVKHLKVDLIPLIANEVNAREIATELGEYVTDVDSELSKRAIRSIGAIAMKIGSVSADMTNSLMELIDMDSPYVRAEAAIVVGNVIRVNPALSNLVLPFVSKCLKRVEDPSAKAVLVWILGEFGENVVEAPYLLESIIDNYAEEQSVAIKLNVLTAAMKLFFKRPPEMQAMLGRLFGVAINETGNQDLHDRSLLYYRLLTTDIAVAKSLFAAGGQFGVANGNFAEMNDLEKRAKLFAEFNSLAVVYGMPSVQFIGEKYQLKLDNAPSSDFDVVLSEAHASISQHYNTPPSAAIASVVSSVATPSRSVNLLDWDDDHTVPQAPVQQPLQQQRRIFLKDGAVIPPARFQQLWSALPEAFSGRICHLTSVPSSGAELESHLRAEKITAIASGPLPASSGQSGLKLFLCASEQGDLMMGGSSETNYLAQLIVLNGSKEVTVIVKTDAPAASSSVSTKLFVEQLLQCLTVYKPIGIY